MISSNEGKLVNMITMATTNATALKAMSFDTLGADTLNLYVACGSHDSATQGITAITISESDTVTSASSMTDIVALSSATATSTSAANALPDAATMAKGGIVTEFQIDLRKRKRYLGVELTTGAAGMPISVIGRLSRSGQSCDTAAEKAGIDLADTSYSGCMAVVAG